MAQPQKKLAGPLDYKRFHSELAQFLQKDLFFIGSYPKSGSTWLQVMLNAHPEIACSGESHVVNEFGPLLSDVIRKQNIIIAEKNKTVFKDFAPFPIFEKDDYRYLLATATAMALPLLRIVGAREARVIGEKTPNNLAHFPILDTLFPHAKFLHIVRDGRDCAVSAWFHNQRLDAEKLAREHGTVQQFAVQFAHGWAPLIDNAMRFCALRREKCLVVRYEELIAKPKASMRGILTFLGVDASDAAVRHCLAQGAFEQMSGGRRRGVEDPSSFVRKGVPGDWREHLTTESNQAFLEIAGAVLKRLGYPLAVKANGHDASAATGIGQSVS